MSRLLQPQNVNASGGMIFLPCFLWAVIGFSFLLSFLLKNKDFRRAVSTFRRLPLFAKAIFVAVISGIIVFGGSKPGGTKPFNFNTWFPVNTTGSSPSLSDAQKTAGWDTTRRTTIAQDCLLLWTTMMTIAMETATVPRHT